MEEYMLLALRTILLYILLLVVFRLMGKREVGELSIIDLAIFVLMAEVAALALDGVEMPFLKAILPIVVLFTIQIVNSFLILKNKKLRDFIEGGPTMIVKDGWILENEMKKQRYNLDDLLQQLREQGVGSVREVAYAFLEPSGKLSVFKKDDLQMVFPIVLDGDIDEQNLKLVQKDRAWLEQELIRIGYPDVRKIFYCSYENGQLVVQLSSRKNRA